MRAGDDVTESDDEFSWRVSILEDMRSRLIIIIVKGQKGLLLTTKITLSV